MAVGLQQRVGQEDQFARHGHHQRYLDWNEQDSRLHYPAKSSRKRQNGTVHPVEAETLRRCQECCMIAVSGSRPCHHLLKSVAFAPLVRYGSSLQRIDEFSWSVMAFVTNLRAKTEN